ncbi:MAG: hypothetical protein ACRDYV_07755, partial [Acidimicrobiia bacterium]
MVAVLLGAITALPAVPARAEDAAVTLKNTKFVPGTVTVAVGESVVWTNEDDVEHTVTFEDGDLHPDCPPRLLQQRDCLDPG